MGLNQDCKHLCHRIGKDFLQFAPCPPPFLSYKEFREHALGRNLTHLEVCSISRRCRPADPDEEEYCKLHHDKTPNVIIIIVGVVSFLAVVFIIVFVVRKRLGKKNEDDREHVQSNSHAENTHDCSQLSDIQMTERKADTIISETESNEGRNRMGDSYKSSDSTSNHALESETEVGRVLEHSDQVNGTHNAIENNEGAAAHNSAESVTMEDIQDNLPKESGVQGGDVNTDIKTGCDNCSIKRCSAGCSETQTKSKHKGEDGEMYITKL